MSWTTQALAEFALAEHHLPAPTTRMARLCLVDLLGAAAAGFGSASAQALRETALALFAPGPAPVWFTGRRLAPAGAVLANAAAASALDLDDGQRQAAGHPGAAIIPAAYGGGEASFPDFSTAVVVGYEIACRIGAARDFSRLPTLSTGRWAAFGAAAAAGRLAGLDRERLAQALAIAGVLTPDLAAAGYSRLMGNQVKEGIPWAACLGLIAVDLARRELTGPLDLLDHPEFYDAARIAAGLGESWAIERVYFKPYACCRWIHAALDGLLEIMGQESLTGPEIDRVTVQTFERALRLANEPDPKNLEAAQYSLPFCLAAAALTGPEALTPLDPALLGRPEVVALARRVELAVDSDLDRLFPDQTPARIIVRAGEREFGRLVPDPKGDPANPLSPAELEAKFRRLSRGLISRTGQDHILAVVATGEGEGWPMLRSVLGRASQSV